MLGACGMAVELPCAQSIPPSWQRADGGHPGSRNWPFSLHDFIGVSCLIFLYGPMKVCPGRLERPALTPRAVAALTPRAGGGQVSEALNLLASLDGGPLPALLCNSRVLCFTGPEGFTRAVAPQPGVWATFLRSVVSSPRLGNHPGGLRVHVSFGDDWIFSDVAMWGEQDS